MGAVTKGVRIVVPESSVMRLFCHGQLVAEIIPERWMMKHAPHLRGTVKREHVGEFNGADAKSATSPCPELRASSH